MPNIFQQIKRTVQGKTKVGRVLHQVLPAKKLRSIAGEALLGLKKASPLPETKDATVRKQVTEADQLLQDITGDGDTLAKALQLKGKSPDQIITKIQQARDLLDDGKLNNTVDDLSLTTKTMIQQAFSMLPLAAYLAHGLLSGDYSIGAFFNFLKSLIGF